MRYAWIVMLAVGCYEAPDYNGTHFKCDATHACPNGQPCVNGFCAGSGSNMIDAPPNASGVLCGGAACLSSQKCCADFINGVGCIALGANCNGFSATCDGKEDCAGKPCCELGGAVIECATTCSGQTICRDNTDCPTNFPQCCPAIGTGEPWGRCSVACP